MSAKAVEEILKRAMMEEEFASLVFTNPEIALAGYDLTTDEIAAIVGMQSNVEVIAETYPQERKSFGWFNHNEILCRI